MGPGECCSARTYFQETLDYFLEVPWPSSRVLAIQLPEAVCSTSSTASGPPSMTAAKRYLRGYPLRSRLPTRTASIRLPTERRPELPLAMILPPAADDSPIFTAQLQSADPETSPFQPPLRFPAARESICFPTPLSAAWSRWEMLPLGVAGSMGPFSHS